MVRMPRWILAWTLCALTLALSGCGISDLQPAPVQGAAIAGRVRGGQQPVSDGQRRSSSTQQDRQEWERVQSICWRRMW